MNTVIMLSEGFVNLLVLIGVTSISFKNDFGVSRAIQLSRCGFNAINTRGYPDSGVMPRNEILQCSRLEVSQKCMFLTKLTILYDNSNTISF